MKEQLQAIVTVLSLVNPVVCGAMFARIEAQRSAAERRGDAMKIALVIVAILAVARSSGRNGYACSACPSTRSWWRVAPS
jgi:multiple antibiotic resistance protein